MSSNLPFIFSSFVYGDKEYIDGGVIENFSFSMLSSLTIDVGGKGGKGGKDDKDDKDDKDEKTEKNIVGIYLDNQVVNSSNDKEYNRLSPVLDKIYAMLMIPTSEYEKQMIQTINHLHVDFITVSVQNIKIYTFKLPHTDKLELFSLGYNRAKEYYKTQTDK
jgi:hypothetical protein